MDIRGAVLADAQRPVSRHGRDADSTSSARSATTRGPRSTIRARSAAPGTAPPAAAQTGSGPGRNWIRPPGFAHPHFREERTSLEDLPPRSYATRAKLVTGGPDAAAWTTVTDRIREHLRSHPLARHEHRATAAGLHLLHQVRHDRADRRPDRHHRGPALQALSRPERARLPRVRVNPRAGPRHRLHLRRAPDLAERRAAPDAEARPAGHRRGPPDAIRGVHHRCHAERWKSSRPNCRPSTGQP